MSFKKYSCVYIMTNKRNGVLYTGVTSNLVKRVWEHKHHHFDGFTDRYNLSNLVYYEFYEEMADAIEREKQIKKGNRRRKILLIEKMNPEWMDLYESLI